MKIIMLLRYIYIFAIPIVDVMSFSPLMPIPLIVGCIILISSRRIIYDKGDLYILATIFFTLIPYVWSLEYVGIKTLYHVIALLGSVIVYYLITKTTIREICSKGKVETLINVICWSLIFSSVYIVIEYTLNNLFGINIDTFIPHLARVDYGASVLDDILRARGFATESGVMAIYYEMYFFILVGLQKLYQLTVRPTRLINAALIFSSISLIFLFSTASILVLFFGFLVLITRQGISLKWISACGVIFSLFVFVFSDQISYFIENTFLNKIAIFYSSDTIGSARERTEIYNENFNVFMNFPLGIGHGIAPEVSEQNSLYFGHSILAGQVSLFLLFLVSGGVFSLFFFILWIANKLRQCQRGILKNYVTASFISIVAHFTLVSEYWLPFFWVSMALYSEIYFVENKLLNDKRR